MRQQSIFDEFNKIFTIYDGCCQENSCTTTDCCKGLAISEDENQIYIDAPLPGVKSDEIKVTLDPRSRHLFIRGEGRHEREKAKYHMRGSLDYTYEIPLSDEANLDNAIDAVSKDGILSITLSKNRGHKPLKIDVKSS